MPAERPRGCFRLTLLTPAASLLRSLAPVRYLSLRKTGRRSVTPSLTQHMPVPLFSVPAFRPQWATLLPARLTARLQASPIAAGRGRWCKQVASRRPGIVRWHGLNTARRWSAHQAPCSLVTSLKVDGCRKIFQVWLMGVRPPLVLGWGVRCATGGACLTTGSGTHPWSLGVVLLFLAQGVTSSPTFQEDKWTRTSPPPMWISWWTNWNKCSPAWLTFSFIPCLLSSCLR